MNRIISANINGFVFQIDEVAYDRLKQYLESLSERIGEREVYDDIENRIAELFSHYLNSGTPAIFLEHVEAVIVQVGSAEELGAAMDAESYSEGANAEGIAEGGMRSAGMGGVEVDSAGKRLFRNEDDMRVYGVCSGIAAYFGWDPVFVRAVFGVLALASFGTVILVYVFLMVIIPAAKTPSEKLQMRGERVNFDNLAKVVDQNVRSAMDNVGPRAKRGLGKTSKMALKVLAAIALIALFSVIVPVVVGGVLSVGMFAFVFDAFYDYFLLGYSYFAGTVIAISAVAFVPVIYLIYGLIRILVNGKKMSPFLRWPLNIAFWVALVFLTWKSVEIGRGFSTSASVNSTAACKSSDTTKIITVKTEPVPMRWESSEDGPSRQKVEEAMGDMDVEITVNGRAHKEGYEFYDLMLNRASNDVTLTVANTLESKPYVTVFKRSRGSRKSAVANAAGLRYDVRWDSTTLILPDLLLLGKNDPWRNPSVEVVLNLPIGYKANIDRSCRDLISYVNDQYLGLDDMENGYASVKSTDSGIEMILDSNK